MIDFLQFEKITDCIQYHVENNPNRLSVSIYINGTFHNYSRKDLWKKVLYYERLFLSKTKKPSLILFIKELDFDLMTAYIAAIKSGNIPAQISPFSSKISSNEYNRRINHIKDLTGAEYLFTDVGKEILENIEVITPQTTFDSNLNINSFDNNIALVQFSSGTTGLQKGAKIAHQALISHMQDYQEFVPIEDDLKIASWLPLYHDLGLISSFLYPLMSGVEFFQINPFEWILKPNLLFELIEKEKITFCTMPNFAFNLLIKKGQEHDLSSMKHLYNSSEPIFNSTMENFQNKFKSLNPNSIRAGYGLAENTMAVAMCKKDKIYHNKIIHGKTVLPCGDLMKNTQVKIFNPDEEGIGEIGLKSPYLFDGLLDKNIDLIEGFYLTGDMGLVEDNILYISGRKKDLIIVNGRNIYPQDIENLVSEVEGIYPGRCVAIGIESDETGSEELFILSETKGEFDKLKLKIAINKVLEQELNIIPKKIEFVESKSLVKTSSGKLSRSRNKELYLAKELNII
jgi:fatty-acyl-CoA synthase